MGVEEVVGRKWTIAWVWCEVDHWVGVVGSGPLGGCGGKWTIGWVWWEVDHWVGVVGSGPLGGCACVVGSGPLAHSSHVQHSVGGAI